MTTIINYNATELLEYLMTLFPKINENQFLKNQIKMIIYLYLTDSHQSYSDPSFHKNLKIKSNLIKYTRFFEYQYKYFQYSINENREYLTISVNPDPLPEPTNVFSNTQFITPTHQPVLEKEKKERRKKPIILSNHREDYVYYNNNKEFTKQFMKPYTGFTSTISIKIFDIMVNVDKFEKERERYINQSKKNSLAEILFNISIIQGDILKNPISSNPTKETVEKKQKKINELIGYVNTYTTELYRCNNNFRHVNDSLENKTVACYKWKKNYCQRTVLLNINKMLLKLNGDVISYIKSFIDPCFLENIRRNCVSERHFSFPKQKINDILNNMNIPQLRLYCENNLWLLYDLNEFKNDTSLNQITDTAMFMDYYHNHNPHLMFDTDILTIYKKKRIIREILEIITNTGLIYYYGFQLEMYVLNKDILKRRRYH